MKAFWTFLAFLVLIPCAVSLDCQYTVPANYEQTVEQIVTPDGRVLDDFIELGEPVPYLDETGCGFEVAVTNEEEIPVRVTIAWRINLTDSTGPHVITDSFDGKNLAPHEKSKIRRSYPNTAACTVLLPTLTYIVHDTASVNIKTTQQSAIGEACKMCNGVACVDDGAYCDTGAQCGSGSCYNGICIGNCPQGDNSCVGLCSEIDSCSSGICDLNRGVCSLCVGNECDCAVLSPDHVQCPDTAACILPSSKENGQGYSCTKECISQYGEEGVCMMTPGDARKRNIYWGVGFVLFVISAWLAMKYGIYDRKVLKKRDEGARVEAANEENKKKLHHLEIDLAMKEKRRNQTEARIRDLEKQATHAPAYAKKRNEEELKKERERTANDYAAIEQDKKFISELKQEIGNEALELAKAEEMNNIRREHNKKNSRENEIKEQTEKYKKEYGAGVYYDEHSDRLKIKFKEGKEYLLHRHIYYTKIRRMTASEEVHHIDNNELNNDKWNLIALDKIKHNKDYVRYCKEKGIPHLIHSQISRRNWESGMIQLHEQLGMEEKDFQENKYIIEHMRELNFSFK